MKKLLSIIPLILSLMIFSTGCGTTEQKIYQTEGVLIHSVDTGMQMWADYVKSGKATQPQVDTVKKSYGYYYASQMTAKAAFEKYLASKSPNDLTSLQTANAAVSVAETELLNILNAALKL